MNLGTELLSSFSQTLSTIVCESELEECVQALLDGLGDCDTAKLDKLTLLTLANETCAAILNFYRVKPVSATCRELIHLLETEGVLSAVYQTAFRSPRAGVDRAINPSSLDIDNLEVTLAQLIKGTQAKAPETPMNIGLAILDLNGDFLWMDEKSESYFETKRLRNRSANLFQAMIPMSRQALVGKFGPALFSQGEALKSSVAFSYVVYSKHSMRRLGRLMVKNGATNPEDAYEKAKPDSKGNFYKQYLRALSSRATLITLSLTAEEYARYWKGVPRKAVTNPPLVVASTADSSHSEDGCGSSDPAGTDPTEAIPTPLTPLLTRTAVLLETRLSFSTPKFDYSVLEADPAIRSFENKTFDRLKNNK
jgi:hypothetical protein